MYGQCLSVICLSDVRSVSVICITDVRSVFVCNLYI